MLEVSRTLAGVLDTVVAARLAARELECAVIHMHIWITASSIDNSNKKTRGATTN